jgi:hypothetical protein
MFRLWQRSRTAAKVAAPSPRRRCKSLCLEALEERRLLSFGLGGGPDVTYHGGPLLQNVQVESVYYGTAWNTNNSLQQQLQQTDGFLNYFVTSPYMSVLSQYNVSNGTFLTHDIIAQDPTGSIDDSQIQTILNSEISSGHLAKPGPNSLYVFFTTPGVEVTAHGQTSVSDFAGYHDTFTDSVGDPVYYAVVPYPNGGVSTEQLTAFQQDTIILSHEVSEAITDPDTQTGWFDPRLGEIGDIAEGTSGLLNGYLVQGVWSQKDDQVVIPGSTTPPTATVQVNAVDVQATAGQAFTGIVATITGSSTTTGTFTASIDWGDGTTSTGTITTDPKGGLDVGGTHTYSQAGWYPITVTVSDQSGTQVGEALSKASVAPAPPTVKAKGVEFTATAGTQFSGVVATFSDARANPAAADFTATIDWGDGTTSTGTVSFDSSTGVFDVSGAHTYANTNQSGAGFGFGSLGEGIFGNQYFVVDVTITDTVAKASATALSLAKVAPAPPVITATGQNIQATAGQQFSGIVATFTDAKASAMAGDFTATINWGDGTTSSGTVTFDSSTGVFEVTGTHIYAPVSTGEGYWFGFGGGFQIGFGGDQFYLVHVSISDTSNDTAVAESLATVAPQPPPLAVTGQNIAATVGSQFTGVVATFTSTIASATASDFTATIDWGDGTMSTGTISFDSTNNVFDVSGTHTYTTPSDSDHVFGQPHFGFGEEGFPLTVSVQSNAGDMATGRALADVSRAPASIQATGTQIQAVVGQPFTGTVATFTTLDPNPTTSTFTASINWGDGTTSTGTIAQDASGAFEVMGTHTYSDTVSSPGSAWQTPSQAILAHPRGFGGESFVVSVTIQDTSNNTSTAVSLASVTPTPLSIVTTSQTLKLTSGTAFSAAVASFTDSDGDSAANFTATISWGDGRVTQGTVTANANGGFDVGGTHSYRDGGTFAIFVRVRDQDGNTAVIYSAAVVADAAPPTVLEPVGASLVQSAEYYADLILKDYQQFLGRTASAPEVAGWVNLMQKGLTDQQALADFVGSPEYYQHAGNTNTGWLNAMYHDLLGRGADAAGENAWLQALATGTSRSNIAVGFAASRERESILVQNDYQQFLDRSAAPAEVAGWVHAFQTGMTNEQIIAGFVGSQEYYQQHNANASDWLTSAYQSVLARSPDQAGFSTWLGVLRGSE